jgi:hypothetical protein
MEKIQSKFRKYRGEILINWHFLKNPKKSVIKKFKRRHNRHHKKYKKIVKANKKRISKNIKKK